MISKASIFNLIETERKNKMTRCYVSEQIAAHCNEQEEAECPVCYGSMNNDGLDDMNCDDEECSGAFNAPGEDDC
jgi:hypothetical protein